MSAVRKTTVAPKSAVYLPITGINSVVRCWTQPTRVEVPLAKRRPTTEPRDYGLLACPDPVWGRGELTGPGPKRPITCGVPALLTYCDVRSSTVGSSSKVSGRSAGGHSLQHSFVVQRLLSDRGAIVLPPYTAALSGQLFPPIVDGLASLSQCPHIVRSVGIPAKKAVVPVLGGSVVIRAASAVPSRNLPQGYIGRKPFRLSTSIPTETECSLGPELDLTHVSVRGRVGLVQASCGLEGLCPTRTWQAIASSAGENTNMALYEPAKVCLRHRVARSWCKTTHTPLPAGHTIGSTQTTLRDRRADGSERKENLTKNPYQL